METVVDWVISCSQSVWNLQQALLTVCTCSGLYHSKMFCARQSWNNIHFFVIKHGHKMKKQPSRLNPDVDQSQTTNTTTAAAAASSPAALGSFTPAGCFLQLLLCRTQLLSKPWNYIQGIYQLHILYILLQAVLHCLLSCWKNIRGELQTTTTF